VQDVSRDGFLTLLDTSAADQVRYDVVLTEEQHREELLPALCKGLQVKVTVIALSTLDCIVSIGKEQIPKVNSTVVIVT